MTSFIPIKTLLFSLIATNLLMMSCQDQTKSLEDNSQVQGWNILSNQEEMAQMVIQRAKEYHVNHLQLSHQIVMDLRHVKKEETANLVNRLTEKAHHAGIKEICIWDHALYPLDYYPDVFKTGPDSLINLDNPEFWDWIKNDYRNMLDLVPEIDGIILTFIETGAHVEDQFSEVMKTEEEKLAAMVDTLASVIIDERGMNLYVRTFVYNKAELSSMLKCINMVKNPKLRVMTKEVPHDFFLTHPVSEFVGQIRFPTIIEFDAAHEYNGQGIITSMFPGLHMERWRYYRKLPNVIGYVARTDRFNNTSILQNPAEINLFALEKLVNSETDIPTDTVIKEFIEISYGSKTIPMLLPAFKMAPEIVQSTFYTLGLNINSHSRLQYNDNSSYQRHVSGKWFEDPMVRIGHDVNKDFHYWKDVVNHLAPAAYKRPEKTQLARESQWVIDSAWLDSVELMNQTYLDYILTEKEFGVHTAREALHLIRQAEEFVDSQTRYDTLLHVFERTLLTSKLYEATAKLFFGFRVLASGNEQDTKYVSGIIDDGLKETYNVCMEMKAYPYKGPVGQFRWEEDIYRGLACYNAVKSRKNDEYHIRFFPYFRFGRMQEEEKIKIWNDAINN
jgi:hypothetical protein